MYRESLHHRRPHNTESHNHVTLSLDYEEEDMGLEDPHGYNFRGRVSLDPKYARKRRKTGRYYVIIGLLVAILILIALQQFVLYKFMPTEVSWGIRIWIADIVFQL